MNDVFKDVTGIAMAIIGVAILFVIVSPKNQTSNVIKAASGGFSQALATAMGTYNGSGMIGMQGA